MKCALAKKTLVINWFAKDRKLTAGLRKFFRKNGPNYSFVTIRLSPKWSNALKHGDRVGISISNDPENLKIIGHAKVISATLSLIATILPDDLEKNIGAKTWQQVLKDMRNVYGKSKVQEDSFVSVIELRPCK